MAESAGPLLPTLNAIVGAANVLTAIGYAWFRSHRVTVPPT